MWIYAEIKFRLAKVIVQYHQKYRIISPEAWSKSRFIKKFSSKKIKAEKLLKSSFKQMPSAK
ncbi:unnamed protein product [Acidithrix sp. C25]|nr:unnamed protein product [Acidithrix sp. C25]